MFRAVLRYTPLKLGSDLQGEDLESRHGCQQETLGSA